MSVRPGVSIIQRSTPPPRSAPTDTGVWHVVGLTDSGPLSPQLIGSMADFERVYGPRVSYSVLYDALDMYFREGGARARVSRVVGPAAIVGSKNLVDGVAATSLVAAALGPSTSSDAITVGVRAGGAGGTFVIYVVIAAVEVETSPDLVDTNAAVLWSAGSNYIRLTQGASILDPVVAAASALLGGTDDKAAITDAEWLAALNLMTADLGPGQVSAPGRTTTAGHLQLLAHARANRRVALLDAPDTATQATLTTSASGARAGDQRFGGMFAPWIIAPGVIAGTTRSIPPSALVAGLLSRNDASGEGPSAPAAGDLGESFFASSLSQIAWSDSVRTILNSAGINVTRTQFGAVRVYGWRSLVDPVGDPEWINLGSVRLYMHVAALASSISEGFLFDKIDGQGKKISEFSGALRGMLMDLYDDGDLYGVTPEEAFYVDVGNQVNTRPRLRGARRDRDRHRGLALPPEAGVALVDLRRRHLAGLADS